MPRKSEKAPRQEPQEETPCTAVEFINHYNGEIDGFEVDLSMQVEQSAEGNVVYAGISVQMGHTGELAFIPSNVLRQLADEADAMAQQAIDDANARHR